MNNHYLIAVEGYFWGTGWKIWSNYHFCAFGKSYIDKELCYVTGTGTGGYMILLRSDTKGGGWS